MIAICQSVHITLLEDIQSLSFALAGELISLINCLNCLENVNKLLGHCLVTLNSKFLSKFMKSMHWKLEFLTFLRNNFFIRNP